MTKRATGPVIVSATLDTILAANGIPTIDEQRAQQAKSRQDGAVQLYEKTGVSLNAAQRKQLKKVMSKAGKDIFGEPLKKD